MTITFDDGLKIDTSGEFRAKCIRGEWYVVGHDMLYPADDEDDAKAFLAEIQADEPDSQIE